MLGSDGVKYGRDVHNHLAEQNLAPDLLHEGFAFRKEKECKFVAMSYLRQPEWRSLSDLLLDPEPLTTVFATTVINMLQAAANALHVKSYVHGDFRATNVLVKDDGNVKIVDFNWSGKSGHVYYPQDLNPEIEWPSLPAAHINEDHDHYFIADMIRRIKEKTR